jgi:acetylornithine/succinyldiaminopimelate/putrescine aminotransferase
LEEKIIENVFDIEKLFLNNLHHAKIKKIRSCGLMMALEFESFEQNKKVIDALLEEGVFSDWFLFAPECLRIVPPLIISENEILKACDSIKKVVSDL